METVQASIDLIRYQVQSVQESVIFSIDQRVMQQRVLERNIFDDILNYIRNLINSVTEIATLIRDTVRGWIDNVVNAINSVRDTLLREIGSIVSAIVSSVTEFVSRVIDQVKGKIAEVWEWLKNAFEDVKAWIEERIQSVVTFLETAFADVKSWVVEAVTTAVEWLKQQYETVRDWIVEKVTTAVETAKTWIGGVVETARTWIGERIGDLRQGISDLMGTLGDIVERWLSRLRDIFEEIKDRIVDTIGNWLKRLGDVLFEFYQRTFIEAKGLIQAIKTNYLDPIANAIEEGRQKLFEKLTVLEKGLTGQYDDPEQFLRDLADPAPIVGAVAMTLIGLVLSGGLSPFVTGVAQAAAQKMTNAARRRWPEVPLDGTTVVNAFYKGLFNLEEAKFELSNLGINEERAMTIIDAARPLPPATAILEAWHRKIITDVDCDRYLAALGFDVAQRSILRALSFYYPPVPDLIRFAVREVFTPEIAAKYGLFDDFPSEFAQAAEKAGLSREWALAYWGAHWQLPSIEQGYEMFHRGIISKDDLMTLLRTQDVMPFWRDKLIQAAYHPLTRVDVRRMYRLGVLDREGVKKAYLDLGYSPEHAEMMTEFTVRYETAESEDEQSVYRSSMRSAILRAYRYNVLSRSEAAERLRALKYVDDDIAGFLDATDLQKRVDAAEGDTQTIKTATASAITRAYRMRIISRSEALSMLKDAEYDEKTADFLLQLEDFTLQYDYHQAQIEVIRNQYVRRLIDENGAVEALGRLMIPAEEISLLIQLWTTDRDDRSRIPAMSDLAYFFRKEWITEEEFADALRAAGYAEKYVRLYVERVKAQMRGES